MDLSFLFDYIRHTYAKYAFNVKTIKTTKV